jgi:hypothetical protein
MQLIEKDNIKGAANPLPLERLRDNLKLQYERYNGLDYAEKDNKKIYDDTALYAGQFKGKCRKCGKQGHKATNCCVKNYNYNNNSNKGNNNYGNKGRNNDNNKNTTIVLEKVKFVPELAVNLFSRALLGVWQLLNK